jgi:hypothetical protein
MHIHLIWQIRLISWKIKMRFYKHEMTEAQNFVSLLSSQLPERSMTEQQVCAATPVCSDFDISILPPRFPRECHMKFQVRARMLSKQVRQRGSIRFFTLKELKV